MERGAASAPGSFTAEPYSDGMASDAGATTGTVSLEECRAEVDPALPEDAVVSVR